MVPSGNAEAQWKPIDEIDILHGTFLAERLGASRELFLGCLKDQFHSSTNKLRMGCEDLREG